ncbi:MAG: N-acetylmuramoyl-L-alanine amidase [Chthoniobacteraceae bacterium]
MQNTMPCVGLAVMAGCLTFVIAPDEFPTLESRIEAALDPALPTIVIDAGHGGKDDGARASGLVEKDLTLDVAIRVDQLLQNAGFTTAFTRETDQYLTLAERAAMANGIENSLFVSLHFNQSTTSAATGVETYYATEKVAPEAAWTWIGYFTEPESPADADTGEELAGYVQAALLNRTNATNRGIKARKLYVVRHTRSPAILVECGFLSNPFEARLIASTAYRDRLAAAIVEGIIQFQKGRPQAEPPTQLVKAAR